MKNTQSKNWENIQFYKIVAVSLQLYGYEAWIMKKIDCNKLEFAKMRSLKECTRLDRRI